MASTHTTLTNLPDGARLDKALAQALPSLSRARIQKHIKAGDITVNGKAVVKHYPLKNTDRVDVEIEEVFVPTQPLADIPAILFEDDDILVIDKPAGVLVHPASGSHEATLVDWLLAHFPPIKNVGENVERPGIVHRLDRDVSGVMVVAKTQRAFEHLKREFKERTVEKSYCALVHGVVHQEDGEIRFSIDRSTRHGAMAAFPDQSGKEALTLFWVKQRFQQYTLLTVKIETGRTNQIRVHLRARSHPIVGDQTYGRRGTHPEPLSRPFLHAERLAFTHPNGERMTFSAPLPQDLANFLVGIRSPQKGPVNKRERLT